MSTASTHGGGEALLAAMLEELRLIRHALERRQPSSLTRADREQLARLLPAIGGVYGGDFFLSSEIAAHGAPAIRTARGMLNARQIGRLLRRAEGNPVDSHTVARCGGEAGATLWQVLKCS